MSGVLLHQVCLGSSGISEITDLPRKVMGHLPPLCPPILGADHEGLSSFRHWELAGQEQMPVSALPEPHAQ